MTHLTWMLAEVASCEELPPLMPDGKKLVTPEQPLFSLTIGGGEGKLHLFAESVPWADFVAKDSEEADVECFVLCVAGESEGEDVDGDGELAVTLHETGGCVLGPSRLTKSKVI